MDPMLYLKKGIYKFYNNSLTSYFYKIWEWNMFYNFVIWDRNWKLYSFIPEGFSPNNDNINDFFEIDHLLNVYLDFELKIFSRYRNLIYKGTHKNGFWDGISNEGITFKHQLVPTGVYFYVLHLNDPQYPNQFIGNVYINY